jgi:hypothetical protein
MEPKHVEMTGLDSYSGHNFIVYFSDGTYATVSSAQLIECFPDRKLLPPPDQPKNPG